MEFKAIADSVSNYAPLLGSVISEINPLAGTIIMMLAKTFNSTSDPEDILSKINADPDAKTKLIQLEIEHKEFLLRNQIDDKKDARNREEKIIELTGQRDWILDLLAIIVIPGFILLCFMMSFFKLENDHLISILIGQLSSGFMLCLSYYFGSSNK